MEEEEEEEEKEEKEEKEEEEEENKGPIFSLLRAESLFSPNRKAELRTELFLTGGKTLHPTKSLAQ